MGEEDHRGNVPSTSHHTRVHAYQLMQYELSLLIFIFDYQGELMFVRILQCKVTLLFLFPCCTLWNKYYAQCTLEEKGVMFYLLESGVCIHWRFVYFYKLFNQSYHLFYVNMDLLIFILYFLGYSPTVLYSVAAPIVPGLTIGNSSRLYLWTFNISPSPRIWIDR